MTQRNRNTHTHTLPLIYLYQNVFFLAIFLNATKAMKNASKYNKVANLINKKNKPKKEKITKKNSNNSTLQTASRAHSACGKCFLLSNWPNMILVGGWNVRNCLQRSWHASLTSTNNNNNNKSPARSLLVHIPYNAAGQQKCAKKLYSADN